MSQASELRDIAEALEFQQAQLAAQKARSAQQDEKIGELERQFAVVHRAQQTIENQIEIFRVGMKDASDRQGRVIDDKFRGLTRLIDDLFRQLRKDMMNGHGE